MAKLILLDAGLVGLACSSPRHPDVVAFKRWLSQTATGADLIIPEITRYEVRRELLRLGATRKLRRLDELGESLEVARITPEAWERAGEFWAIVRRAGRPTAHPEALDADAILAAVAATIGQADDQVVIATTNIRHLGWFPGVDARIWQDIA